MRSLFTIVLILIITTGFNSCKNLKENGRLYITDQTQPETEIATLKILKRTKNQSDEKNILLDFTEKVDYGGYTWYVYEIPKGSWDVYMEYYQNGDFCNDRESIYIDGSSSGNAWAAIWPVDNLIYDIWTEQGSGELKLLNSLFN